jgi:fatty acid desaturase
MPTREAEHAGIGEAVGEVAEHAKTIANLEVRLALAELKEKIAALAVGIGAGVAAGIMALFGLGFGAATAAAALELVLPTWAALLIVTGIFVLLAGGLAVVALLALGHASPPVPTQAMQEAKLTTEALKANGNPHARSRADAV